MKCWNCGNEVSGGRFCGSCGADQEQNPQGAPSGGGRSGNEIILTVFAALCGVVYGAQAVRGLWAIVKNFFGFFFYFWALISLIISVLTVAFNLFMCVVLIGIATKRTRENSDSLLILLTLGGAGSAAVALARMVLSILFRYGFSGPSGSFAAFLAALAGAAVSVLGVFAILRFVLGEFPLAGKSTAELQWELKATLGSFGRSASAAAENARAERDARAAERQQYAQQQPPYGGQQPYGQPQDQPAPPPMGYAAYRLKADRSLVAYILLSFITCGIYSWYFIYALARDVNTVCAGDGRSTAGLIKLILLSIITCGFYNIYWYYSLGNRLAANAPRYGLNFQENGTTVLLWILVGSLACGIGPFIAWHIIIKNTNSLCGAYNYQHGI